MYLRLFNIEFYVPADIAVRTLILLMYVRTQRMFYLKKTRQNVLPVLFSLERESITSLYERATYVRTSYKNEITQWRYYYVRTNEEILLALCLLVCIGCN